MFWIALAFALLFLLLVWAFIVRPLLKQQPVLSDLFKEEETYFTQLRVKMVGWKTKALARAVTIASVLVMLHDVALPLITQQDWTPISSQLPPWAWSMIVIGLSLLFNYLRNLSDNPPIIQTTETPTGPQVVAVVAPVK